MNLDQLIENYFMIGDVVQIADSNETETIVEIDYDKKIIITMWNGVYENYSFQNWMELVVFENMINHSRDERLSQAKIKLW